MITRSHVLEQLSAYAKGEARRSNEDAQEPGTIDERERNPFVRGDHPLKPAAVLVPLVERPAGLTVLLTRRTDHLTNHGGQISFPGGRCDADDADCVATALRETEEELGLNRRHVDVAGELDDYIVGTGYLVRPVIGLVRPPFDLTPHDHEVAEVFEAPLAFVLDPTNIQRHARDVNGAQRHYFAIQWQSYYIWGATAGMLRNLSQVLWPKSSGPNPGAE